MRTRIAGVVGRRPRLCDLQFERDARRDAELNLERQEAASASLLAEYKKRAETAEARAASMADHLRVVTESRDKVRREHEELWKKMVTDRRLLLIMVAMLDKLLLDGKAGEA